ncbi:LUD domain-containing protein [Candidatus Gottesmanbacteria bacterium]|nr:LUD domain-containing protein [Candidatus Gottesmanbacteria bacterium]
MKNYNMIPSRNVLQKTVENLKKRGIDAVVAENGQDAKNKVRKLIPHGAEVFDSSSTTLETLGIAKEIQKSGKYDSVRKKLTSMDRKTQNKKMQSLGATPEWIVGSVHAVTEDGEVLIASNTGSQLPAYAYGSAHVIWVVGAQKIVKDLKDGFKRIYEYVLPLESKRVQKAYGMEKSNVSKLLVVNNEIQRGRITVILVKEKLGF